MSSSSFSILPSLKLPIFLPQGSSLGASGLLVIFDNRRWLTSTHRITCLFKENDSRNLCAWYIEWTFSISFPPHGQSATKRALSRPPSPRIASQNTTLLLWVRPLTLSPCQGFRLCCYRLSLFLILPIDTQACLRSFPLKTAARPEPHIHFELQPLSLPNLTENFSREWSTWSPFPHFPLAHPPIPWGCPHSPLNCNCLYPITNDLHDASFRDPLFVRSLLSPPSSR